MTSNDAIARLRKRLEQESSEGLLLVRNLQDNPICDLSFDGAVPCLTLVWKRYATSTQLRYVHESIIALLARHGVAKVLSDDTALPTVHAEDRRWIVDDWMPRAIAAGFTTCAAKVSVGYFGRLSTEKIHSKAPDGLQVRSFDSLDEARRWLKEQPPSGRNREAEARSITNRDRPMRSSD